MRRLLLALSLLCGLTTFAEAQQDVRIDCFNGSQWLPCPTSGLIAGSGNAGYPPGSVAVANAGAGTTGATTATLPATANAFTYLCNLKVSAAGSGSISPITISGVQGGSWIVQGISAGGAPYEPTAWTPCLRSSAVNTAIVITTTADGTATAVNVQASGFTQ